MTSNNNSTDDGSLSFLNIQPDEANKHSTARKPPSRN